MELLAMVVRAAVWLAMNGGGSAPAGDGPEECVRGQIIPC